MKIDEAVAWLDSMKGMTNNIKTRRMINGIKSTITREEAEPVIVEIYNTISGTEYKERCPRCRRIAWFSENYCPKCGKKLVRK